MSSAVFHTGVCGECCGERRLLTLTNKFFREQMQHLGDPDLQILMGGQCFCGCQDSSAVEIIDDSVRTGPSCVDPDSLHSVFTFFIH